MKGAERRNQERERERERERETCETCDVLGLFNLVTVNGNLFLIITYYIWPFVQFISAEAHTPTQPQTEGQTRRETERHSEPVDNESDPTKSVLIMFCSTLQPSKVNQNTYKTRLRTRTSIFDESTTDQPTNGLPLTRIHKRALLQLIVKKNRERRMLRQ